MKADNDDEIYFTVSDFTSPKLKIDDTPRGFIYQWSDMSVFVPEISKGFIINFYFGDHLLWTKQLVSSEIFQTKGQTPKLKIKKPKTESKWVKMNNSPGSVYIQYQRYIDGILLSKVFLSAVNLSQQIENMHHKITCLVGGLSLDEYAYLGRAQTIDTNYQQSSRVYIWEAKTGETFPNVKLHDKSSDLTDQIGDINRIKLNPRSTTDIHALLSHRTLNPMHKSHEFTMDNDDFSNAYRVLPVNIGGQNVILIRFYNFKFKTPRCTEIKIPHDDLIQTDNRLTIKLPEIDGVLTIYHTNATFINSVILTVKDYINNLNFKHDIRMVTN